MAPSTKPFRLGSLTWPITARQWQALSDMVEDVYQRLKEGVGQVRTFTGDVTGSGSDTIELTITADSIVNADINSAAGIVDTKLDTIATALKVSNSATTATSANTASAIVARDANGDFIARYIGITRLNDSAGTRLLHYTGTANLFVGVSAGNFTTSGVGMSTVIGEQAGINLSTGYQNTLLGRSAGSGLTTGYGNTFLGKSAGQTSQDGYYNVMVGLSAGSVSTTGYQNCFMGSFTGSANTTGLNNTFIGDSAGRLNVDGLSNTFLGRAAGDANVNGNYGVFAGHQAGFRNTSGSYNVFLGDVTGQYNTTGTRNVAVGEFALCTTVVANANVSGDDNTCVGYNTGPTTTAQFSKSTAIGQGAQYGASSVLILGGTGANAVKVGIGIAIPTVELHVVGAATITGALTAALTGNATTATTLATARNINGVSFNGSADITVAAAAGTLTGATLAAGVTASSLTTVGNLSTLRTAVAGVAGAANAASVLTLGAALTIPSSGNVTNGIYNIVTGPAASTTQFTGYQDGLSTAAAAYTLTLLIHHYITDVTIGAGSTVTVQQGIRVAPMANAGTSNYGIVIGKASTQTLWVGDQANDTTAAAGIGFGSSRDTVLYRSAVSTLKTDNALEGLIVHRLKAGTPSDADVTTPASGMMIVDTTASKIWVRVGTTWKSVAVA
jgi:hypothetical protein